MSCNQCSKCNNIPLERKEGNTDIDDIMEEKSSIVSVYIDSLECPSQITQIHSSIRTLPNILSVFVKWKEKAVIVNYQGIEIETKKAGDIMEVLQRNDFQGCRIISNEPNSSGGIVRSKLYVSGICCASECPMIRSLLEDFPGVISIQINIALKMVYVEHYPNKVSATTLANTLSQDGFEAQIIQDGASSNLQTKVELLNDTLTIPEGDDTTIKGIPENKLVTIGNKDVSASASDRVTLQWSESFPKVHVILSGFFWFLSLLSYIGGDWEYLQYLGVLSVLFGMPPSAWKAWKTLRRCQFDANCMMVISAFGALALLEFVEAASVAFLFSISDYLEAKATFRARNALSSIVAMRPEHAQVIKHPGSQDFILTPADEVQVGNFVLVRTGDKIVADGIVVEGTTDINESSLTGEPIPITKCPGDSVSGGTLNAGNSPITIRIERPVEDSAVSRLIRLVEEAQANRSPTELLVDSFARSYTPFVLLLAACMFSFPWLISYDIGHFWTMNGLIIILIACPCALTISTPVTYAAGLAACAQKGVIIKGGATLEALGSIKTVVVDKTGTITEGNFHVKRLEPVNNQITRSGLLELLILLESPSSHPLSRALVKIANDEGIDIVELTKSRIMQNHTLLKGEGVMADVDGKKVYIGNRSLFERLGMYNDLGSADDWLEDASNEGGTIGFLGVEGLGIVGGFHLTDTIRNGATELIACLRNSGIDVVMLTGDGEGAAKAVARQIGLPMNAVHSQLHPEDKLQFVKSLIQPTRRSCVTFRQRASTVMVGDGINDAPALAAADVGIAMSEGAALAMETSDITLMDCNLSKLLYTINIGKRVVTTIKENIFLCVIVKVVTVTFTFMGKMTLLSAIASDLVTMLIVTLNGVRLIPSRHVSCIAVCSGSNYETMEENVNI
jgi:Zn2+/Cd2+-exporting ATPase